MVDELALYLGGRLVGLDDVALGELLPASESFDSVCNPGGDFGSPFSPTSIFNSDSVYGGPFGTQSPFNSDAVEPPRIVVAGEVTGRLSVSLTVADAVDPAVVLGALGCPELAQ